LGKPNTGAPLKKKNRKQEQAQDHNSKKRLKGVSGRREQTSTKETFLNSAWRPHKPKGGEV